MKPVSCARPSRVKRGWTIPSQWSFESEKNIELNAMMCETILGTSFVRFHVRILGLHTYLAWWWPSLYVACHKSPWNYCWALSWELVGIGNNNTFFWGGSWLGVLLKSIKIHMLADAMSTSCSPWPIADWYLVAQEMDIKHAVFVPSKLWYNITPSKWDIITCSKLFDNYSTGYLTWPWKIAHL